jgi:hypothetical protein
MINVCLTGVVEQLAGVENHVCEVQVRCRHLSDRSTCCTSNQDHTFLFFNLPESTVHTEPPLNSCTSKLTISSTELGLGQVVLSEFVELMEVPCSSEPFYFPFSIPKNLNSTYKSFEVLVGAPIEH